MSELRYYYYPPAVETFPLNITARVSARNCERYKRQLLCLIEKMQNIPTSYDFWQCERFICDKKLCLCYKDDFCRVCMTIELNTQNTFSSLVVNVSPQTPIQWPKLKQLWDG